MRDKQYRKPHFFLQLMMRLIMLYCTTTSSAVVGSSKITKSGFSANAIAMTTRCFIPPDNSCGYALMRSGSILTSSSRMRARAKASSSRYPHVPEWRPSADSDCYNRIQVIHCTLQHHRGFFQRNCRISSPDKFSRFFPWNSIVPSTICAPLFSSCMIANAIVDFPQPDSPARPKNSPRWISKDTPLTACTWPRSAVYSMARF